MVDQFLSRSLLLLVLLCTMISESAPVQHRLGEVGSDSGGISMTLWGSTETQPGRKQAGDTQIDSSRAQKNNRYNGGCCDLTRLDPAERVINITTPRTEFIPIKGSAVIAVGTVSGMETFLSGDRTRIYTEVRVSVEDLLQDKHSKTQREKDLVFDLLGGTVKLESGRVIRDETIICYLGKPHVGGRYIFFLRPTHKGQDLTLITGYELRNGSVYELAEDGGSGNEIFTRNAGRSDPLSNEAAFLGAVKDRITQSSKH